LVANIWVGLRHVQGGQASKNVAMVSVVIFGMPNIHELHGGRSIRRLQARLAASFKGFLEVNDWVKQEGFNLLCKPRHWRHWCWIRPGSNSRAVGPRGHRHTQCTANIFCRVSGHHGRMRLVGQ
jgi:hypothetical protein